MSLENQHDVSCFVYINKSQACVCHEATAVMIMLDRRDNCLALNFAGNAEVCSECVFLGVSKVNGRDEWV